ncbi:class I SAM-dependent methyltransferase [Mesorhizobium sp. AaZ16]|uniref:class I SAM-dependent methyltransferase n=1 Tax=Mesorhizobium sp. AaZ16 TaxID=3402289 RepID=UPI00374F7819
MSQVQTKSAVSKASAKHYGCRKVGGWIEEMEGFTASTFGELNAAEYDELHDPGTTEETVRLISELAGEGSILELAIGTGRVALPLVALGHRVSGIEGSLEMIEKLREKPGSDAIDVTIGDFADVNIKGPFDHVFLVFNTLFNLQSQEDQIRCFRNVADRLNPGGTFMIETFVPDFSGFSDGQRVRTKRLDKTSVWIEAALHDPVCQLFEYQRIRVTETGVRLVPLPMRYAWPSEIDLMARLAGLTRIHRWGGYDRSQFDASSKMHVSVYQK